MTASSKRSTMSALLVSVFMSAMLTFIFSGCRSAPDSIEEQIRNEYAKIERAYASQDFDGLMASRDHDLVVVVPESNGEIENYERTAQIMRRWFAENKPPISVQYEIESMDIGSLDKVVVRVVQKGSRYRGEGSEYRHVTHEVRQRETWIRGADGWKVRRIDEIDYAHRKVWVNGRPIPLDQQ